MAGILHAQLLVFTHDVVSTTQTWKLLLENVFVVTCINEGPLGASILLEQLLSHTSNADQIVLLSLVLAVCIVKI